MQWTDRDIKRFKPKEGQVKPFDIREKSGSGFGVTVFPSAEKSFIYFYTFQGRKRRMTLGKYPHCTLAKARSLHREALAMLEAGKDPANEKKQEKIHVRDTATVGGLIDEYLEKHAKPNKRSWEEDVRSLNKDIRPNWGKRKVYEITRRDVVLLLDGIKERGSSIQANRMLACIRKMFNFAIERDIVVTANPCNGVKGVKETRRDRVLSTEEISIIWHGMTERTLEPSQHTIHMSEQTKLALKFQLVTAQRKGEVIAAEWEEFDLNARLWTIPASKAKNNQAHRVPLSDLALSLLHAIKELSGVSRFLFPAKLKDGHIAPTSIDHAVRRSTFIGVNPFTPHDLRRSASSHMTSIGIPRLTLQKILNHSDGSVTAIYDRHSYNNEKRLALETWAQKLKDIVYGVENV